LDSLLEIVEKVSICILRAFRRDGLVRAIGMSAAMIDRTYGHPARDSAASIRVRSTRAPSVVA
jgi:hypothetical protein